MDGNTSKGPSFMTGAHNFHIDQQNNNVTQIFHSPNPRGVGPEDDTPFLSTRILDASHLRDRKRFPPSSSCFPGTRKAIVDEILSWTGLRLLFWIDKTHVLWLYGYVGCGKSSIAQTISEELSKQGRLGASFFFFRGSGDRSRSNRFAATIASQLASAIPSTASYIEAAVKKHPGLRNYSLGSQFECLVYEPLIAAAKRGLRATWAMLSGPVIIVIDGLDECEDHDEIAAWIVHMMAYFKAHPLIPLRFVISSRMEEYIRSGLQSNLVKLVNLISHPAQGDIALVVKQTFNRFVASNRALQALGPNWPSQGDQDQLVNHAGGSFLFMATLLKFVLESKVPGSNPVDRLSQALNINPGLDPLYTATLERSEHLPHFHRIIWILAMLEDPLSIKAIAWFLQVTLFDVVQVLVPLHSILHVPESDDAPVTVCHSSLREFLNTKGRSGRFAVTPAFQKEFLGRCVQGLLLALNSLQREIGFETSSELTLNIRENLTKYWQHIPLDLQNPNYAEKWKACASFLSSQFQGDLAPRFDHMGSIFALTLEQYVEIMRTPSQDTRKLLDKLADVLYMMDHWEPYTIEIVASMFEFFVLEAPDTFRRSGCRELGNHLKTIRANFLNPCFETALLARGCHYLAHSRPNWSTEWKIDWRDEHMERYMTFFWPGHLLSAIEKDPNLSTDRLKWKAVVTSDSVWTYTLKSSWLADLSGVSVARLMPGIQASKNAIERKHPDAYSLVKQGHQWRWIQCQDVWYLRIHPVYSGGWIGYLDIILGLEQWVKCIDGACDHDAGCAKRARENKGQTGK